MKVLVPIDFSDNSTNALLYACQFAKESKASLVVFHSYPLQPKNPFMGLEEILALEKSEEKKAEEKLHEFVKAFLNKNPFANEIHIDFSTRLGFAVENVISMVENGHFDLIIMGTKGAGNVKTKLLGTNTAVVIDNVEIPVLAVPAEARWKLIKNIVVATDLMDFRFNEIKFLGVLANVFDALITLIHVHHSQREKNKFNVESFLHLAKTDFQYDNIIVKEMMEDDLEEVLNKMAENQEAELLAMTLKQRSFFQKIFYPDISRELFYQSKAPLLALHAEN